MRLSSRDLYVIIRRLQRSLNARTGTRAHFDNDVIGSRDMASPIRVTLSRVPIAGTIHAYFRGQRVVVGTSTILAATDNIAFSGRHGQLQKSTTYGPFIFDYEYDPRKVIVVWGPVFQTIIQRRRTAPAQSPPFKLHRRLRGAGVVAGYR